MKIRNLGIAVLRSEKKVTQVGEIIIPETASVASRTREGTVMATGQGTKSQRMEVKIGDEIVYKRENFPQSEGMDIIDLNDVLYVK
jgi:co-chaperonin GroES (HSP10)